MAGEFNAIRVNYPLGVDKATEALVVIPQVTHLTHEGSHYYLEGYTELNTDGTLYVKLVTPNTDIRVHITWEISSSGILTALFYEGVSGGMANGTGATPLNNDRNSSNKSTLSIMKGVTVASNLGTTISETKVGGTTFKGSVGGAANRTHEIILKQDTIYLRKFLSGSDTNVIAFRASWVEFTHSN